MPNVGQAVRQYEIENTPREARVRVFNPDCYAAVFTTVPHSGQRSPAFWARRSYAQRGHLPRFRRRRGTTARTARRVEMNGGMAANTVKNQNGTAAQRPPVVC